MRLLHRLRTIPDQYLVAVVLVLVPFYALLTVAGSSIVGHYTLLRLWPEVILAGLAVWAGVLLARDDKIRSSLRRNRLVYVIASYVLLNLLLAVVAHQLGHVSTKAMLYGVLINTRFLIWFLVVWTIALRNRWLRTHWQQITFVPLAIVAVFALLQFFVLPSNFLAHVGYDKLTTIPPAQTINQDTDTIRAQSSLRGPNQLGAYLVLGIGLLAVSTIVAWQRAVLGAVSLLALIVSFSRSAWLGLIAETAAAAVILLSRKQLLRLAAVATVAFVVAAGALFLVRNDGGVQNALFHVDRNQTTAKTTSDSGHASALQDGVNDIVHQPFGMGPGTAGPASGYNTAAPQRNSESYILTIGQELGVLGMGLFIWILVELSIVLIRTGTRFGKGLVITLVGLTTVSLLSYVWADPTVAYLWWGLAGIAVAGGVHKTDNQ